MGYILALVFIAVAAIVLFIAIGVGRRGVRGRLPSSHDPVREEPAADAPTPGTSSVAGNAQASAADRKTPPA